MPDANATQSYVSAQLQNRPIAAFMLQSALAAIIGLVAGVQGSALTGSAKPVVLPATANSAICLTAGQSVTLPAGAAANTVAMVSDCTPDPAAPSPLAAPEVINAATDATIAGAASYSITLTGQGVGFRKTLAGPWQPF